MEPEECLSIVVKLTGGAEYLFDNAKSIDIRLPPIRQWKGGTGLEKWTIGHFLKWLGENYVKERPEMFFQDDSVRPGILVLVNEVDWELVGQLNYEIQKGDTIMFMSTLHGG